MMFKEGFVVAIKNNHGKILRESLDQEVFLPYHSSYSIRLKNNHSRRAVASVSVDGTNVLGNRQIIVPARGTVDVERFCIDGNLNAGNKFEFVPLEDGRVQDPTSSENGVVKIKFQLEQEIPTPIPIPITEPIIVPYEPIHYGPNKLFSDYSKFSTSTGPCAIADASLKGICGGSIPSTRLHVSPGLTGSEIMRSTAGATVEGGRSNQSFYESNIGELEIGYTEITLMIRPSAGRPVTVQNTKKCYCFQCGTRHRFLDTYCTKCGSKLKN